tara:strand:- start:65434 stop:67389 length:1956 start_codon:yes stop_codon:yes gene_type:complete
MAVSLGKQYDKRAFLGAKAHKRWKQTIDPKRHKSDRERLKRIEGLAQEMSLMEQVDFRRKVQEWRALAANKELKLEEIIEPAFAMVREASRRTTGLFHYPEQILAGLALVRGGVAEMATGEGKTLGVTLPAFVFALFGEGVHVITVNSYLAERDHEFTAPILEYLGISSALLLEGQEGTPVKKKTAYLADVTYGVGYEFGFDYLRDQLALIRAPKSGPRERLRNALMGVKTPEPPVVQRKLAYAIIDEVDSVLIDEAGSPLVISESPPGENEASPAYWLARDVAEDLIADQHFELKLANRGVKLTHEGFDLVHEFENIPWDLLRRPWHTYVLNALRALHFFQRDVHYVVDDEDKVVIIDEFTGRRFEERTWRDGLHQAVEAKEEVEIRSETDSAASITRQRYFGFYETICGLTGTAAESAGEFWHFFKMDVEPVPLHKPSQRKILPERVFQTQDAMYHAVVADVIQRYQTWQPILIGTRTIRASEALAELMTQSGVPFTLLTAKQDEEESEIVAKAGQPGHVLLATNMAGRGTHIGLTDDAKAAGGLHVIVVERNESIRIDRQLIGRGARQGEVGGAQMFVSADDHLVEMYAPELATEMRKARADSNGELPGKFSKDFDELQAEVERRRYEQRLAMAHRDKWLDEIKTNLA